jgi:uncharacterized delta-60 repeat protein
VVIQADGKIVAGGGAGGLHWPAIAATEHWIPTCGGDGRVVTAFPVTPGYAADLAIQADRRIVAVGESDSKFALARYEADGSLDATFGIGGTVVTSFPGTSAARAAGVALQSDGKIVVVGSAGESCCESGDTTFDFALARYLDD